MDKCSSDAEFDSYWDYEAKNKNRNRIRVGRQYQATVPPLLKPGEKDGRKCEELETLKWKPDQLSDQEVEQYLSMAKGIGLFAKAVDNPKIPENSDKSLQSAIKGLSEFVASHHPCHHDDGCQVPKPSSSGESTSKINVNNDWSPSEAQLFAQALEACGKNFCAIKKEFLPWKPVRSIIEYYYQGKSEKSQGSSEDSEAVVSEKKETDEPVASCSHEEKLATPEAEASTDDPLPENPDKGLKEEPNIFLENSRVTDHCSDVPEFKMSVNDDETIGASSTVGSLKFFLGGRLVLKLNAQQDSGSGTKCQWVQSNDLPKLSNSSKKVKHKKKSVQDGSFVVAPDTPLRKKKADDLSTNRQTDYDTLTVKKPKVKTEYDFTENDKQGLLLCSSSWTPPVADGHDSMEMDDGSSKTSEGYISPVLSTSRSSKGDVRSEIPNILNSVNELGEQKCDSDPSLVKYESRSGSVQSENCFVDDSASKNICFLGGKNSPNQFSDDASLKQEVLNHKSALSHSKSHLKSPCYQPRTSHSSSPLLKQWNKWSNMSYPVKMSPNSLSPVSVVDSKSPIKEIPLDLSSKLEGSSDTADQCDASVIYKTSIKLECQERSMPSEVDFKPASNDFSPQSSSLGSHPQSIESPYKEMKGTACKCSEEGSAENQQYITMVKKETNDYSPSKSSGDSNQLPYTYCNLPYHCALPKCTKDYSLEEHLCNKSNADKNQGSSPSYIIHDVDENMCKKNPAWCRASYLQFYPQCYPYYVTYGIASPPVSEPTVAEVPLDLSSANENIKEKNNIPDALSEDVNDVPPKSTDAVERGMLYQLLKNKTSK